MSSQHANSDAAAGEATPGMAAEHAVLGLLAVSESGSGHGYDLARHFGSDAPLGSVIRLEPGMVYHHLKKIERIGWVSVVPDVGQGRPARRLFALSSAGRDELARWLAEPVAHTREIRLEFLVKLYFALLLDPVLAVRLIDEQRETCARIIAALSDRSRDDNSTSAVETREQKFGDMVLDMRLAQTHAALDWLDRVRLDAMAVEETPELGNVVNAGP